MKPLPFKLDRERRTSSLVEQVVDGFRQAIVGGAYRVGDRIPSLRNLAKELGVSLRVPREAIAILADEGFLHVRQGIGCEVGHPGMPMWRGRVMIISPGWHGGYYFPVFAGRIQERLERGGYFVSRLSVHWGNRGEIDYSRLEATLSQRFDLAIMMADCDVGTRQRLEQAGVPILSMCLWGKPLAMRRHCVGRIGMSYDRAMAALAGQCKSKGVRHVWQIGYQRNRWSRTSFFTSRGIACREFIFARNEQLGYYEGIRRGAQTAFGRLLDGGRTLPDAIFFTDDYVANGILVQLAERGIRIPQDVRVAALSNAGLGLVSTHDVTRIEMDPFAHGDLAADKVLAILGGKNSDEVLWLAPSFVAGETL